MKSTPQTVSNIFGKTDKNTDLSRMLRRAQALGRMNKLLQNLLPANLHNRCKIANIRDKQLIIHAESASWATLLRYEQTNILNQLQAHPDYAFIRSISIKVAPEEQANMPTSRHANRPSLSGKNSIRALADILEDDQLKASVDRLARSVEDS